MLQQIYNWKRFWCPRNAQINLDYRGYLVDPNLGWGYQNTELVDLKEIADIPCLVLLGEPGIGKSQEMETLIKYTEEKLNLSYPPLEFNLRSCSSLAELTQNQDFIDWISGEHSLYLFLDSLDEGLLEIRNLATQLVDEFRKRKYRDKLHRLYLRISCRTAVFPQVLEEGLGELWKEDLAVYKLAPLRYEDVEAAAVSEGIEPQGFLSEIRDKNLVSLAIKPITLKFLINTFQQNNKSFPPNQRLADLYLDGCRLLCKEQSKSRQASGRVGNLETEQRLVIAARIAAITVFANRFTVWDIDQGKVPKEDVLLRELGWGNEITSGRKFEVNEAAIREVLDSSLFSFHGQHQTGWAHQTYAEFLAAWYLKCHSLNLEQLLNLITHPDQRIVPQLQETAAWLASMIPEVFQAIAKTDPDVLLQSDIATASETEKATLVESLLRLYDQDKLVYHYRFKAYEYLKHSELAVQLQSYISDSKKSINSRYMAIDIAEDCNVQAVQSNLADVVLDSDQYYYVRTHAANALVCIGDEQTKMRLKPLAIGSQNDPEDELKGYALRAIYPNHISTEEVLNCLTRPKATYIGGTYQDFVAKELGQHLPMTDLPVALEWLEQQPTRRELNYPFNALSDEIMLKAWANLEDPEILSRFAQIALLRLSQYDELISSHEVSFKQLLEENNVKRRQLLEAVIAIIPNSEKEPSFLSGFSSLSILTPLKQDFQWLIEKLQKSDSDQIQRIYAQLIYWKIDWSSTDQISALVAASQGNPILQVEFSQDLEPILLNSPKAEKARLNYIKLQEMPTYESKQKLLNSSPKERVLTSLEQFESGKINAWVQLCREMTLMPTSTHYRDFKPDLTTLPGWQEAEEEARIRIIAAAKSYIIKGATDNNWLGTSDPHTVLAGYQALNLVLEKDLNCLNALPAKLWGEWIPIILSFPYKEDKHEKRQQTLLKKAYGNAPNEFIKALIILIDQENTQYGTVLINSKIRCCWDEHLATVLLNKAQDEKLTAESLGNLLRDLLVHRVEQAKVLAESLISLPLFVSSESRDKAIIAAKQLMLYTEDAGWSVIWNAIQQDPEFGQKVLEAVSYVAKYEGNIEQRLREDSIADLYIFLVRQYPDSNVEQRENSEDGELTDPKAYAVEPEYSIRTWRDNIPQRLQERGTPEACKALEKIIHELPELKHWLQGRLLEAEALTRRQNWQPLQPKEFLQIVLDQDKRLVQDGHQLLKVLLESLERLELELQQTPAPAIRDLWDKDKGKNNLFYPIEENAFSEYVKRFLDRDLKSRGIIANREVELSRTSGGEPGERTDIQVDAVLKRPNGEAYDSITVIIEVKGCWHPKVKTAMESQLVKRYLVNNICKYGLYLVGWFNCPQWDNEDSRKEKAPKMLIDEARKLFDEQAETLSSSGNVVRAYVMNTALR